MSASGFTPIQLYYSTTAAATPSAGNLANGELALNITDGKLYYKNNSGVVTLLASAAGASGDVVGPGSSTDNALVRFDSTTGKLVQNSAGILDDSGNLTGIAALTTSGALTLNGGTANGVAYLNGSKVLTTGSALTFDGSLLKTSGALSVQGISFPSSGAGLEAVYDGTEVVLQAYNRTSPAYLPIWLESSYTRFGINGSEQMRLTSTGLGIGTSSPGQKLHVVGTGQFNALQIGANNTDINQSTSNPIVFKVLGTEYMRLDSSGNLGLGVTPSASSTSARVLQIRNSLLEDNVNGYAILRYNDYYDGSSDRYISTGAASAFQMQGGAFKWYTAPSGTAGNAISFTQAMTLDASGNLGLGITNPNFVGGYTNFVVSNASNGGIVYVDRVGGARGYFYANGTTSVVLGNTSSIPLTFETNNTERARIDASGNLLVGATNTNGIFTGSEVNTGCVIEANGGAFARQRNADAPVYLSKASGFTNGNMIIFYVAGSAVGSISVTGSATSYNTSSDYRLKNTIAPMTGALAKVALLKPCTYKWNADGSDGEGFIAHELAEVVPQCVTGEKDAVDADGNPRYQGIDTSFLVATVVAAIQELKAEFDAYKASHP